MPLPLRPRRLRASDAVRRLARETRLTADALVQPLFVVDGEGLRQPIEAMPGQVRYSPDTLAEACAEIEALGLPAVALFPKVEDGLKDATGSASLDPDGLYPRAVRAVKAAAPGLAVMTDVALDPYSSDGHDGVVRDGAVANDETLDLLARMAVVHAEAGADVIAPSDMMDGRVGAIRSALDGAGHTGVSILAYTAKYASALYGPFRAALDSAPRERPDVPEDKRTYQMDPANAREALRELSLDLAEGADMVMVKPALAYLDVVRRLADASDVPVAAYHVSGEYAMLHAAADRGWLDLRAAATEHTLSIRRAGADVILTYFARDLARWLREG